MNRFETNKKILNILTMIIEEYPEQRFNQLLINFGAIKDVSGINYYIESDETLNILEESLLDEDL